MKKMLVIVLVMFAGLNGFAQSREVENLAAFGKLYGCARWFCPSDEVASVDWDKLALCGVEKTRNAPSTKALMDSLGRLFNPVVPQLRFAMKGALPEQKTQNEFHSRPTYWQHQGVALTPGNIWVSHRTNRPGGNAENPDLFFYLHNVAANKPLNVVVKLNKTMDVGVGLSLVENSQQGGKWEKHTTSTSLDGNGWKEYRLELNPATTVDILMVGLYFTTVGNAELSSFSIEIGDTITHYDASRIQTECNFSNFIQPVYNAEQASLSLRYVPFLFSDKPAPHPAYSLWLTDSLWCELPTVLGLTDDGKTQPSTEGYTAFSRMLEPYEFSPQAPFDGRASIASVIITWNVFRYFYPYPEDMPANWDGELFNTLAAVIQGSTEQGFLSAINTMLAKLQDAHIGMIFPEKIYDLPVRFNMVEGKVIVARVGTDTLGIQPGDEVVSIDRKSALDEVADWKPYISGSPQYKQYFATAVTLGAVPDASSALFAFKRRGEIFVKTLERYSGSPYQNGLNFYNSRLDTVNIMELEQGIYYIKLGVISAEYLDNFVDSLGNKLKGVVMDVRNGIAMSNGDILKHFSDTKPEGERYFFPCTQYPGEQFFNSTSPNKEIWAGQKRITNAVFISDASMISQQESLLNDVQANRFGLIVGSQTGGTNGNINRLSLFDRYSFYFTGLRVLKADGSKHNTIGVIPDVMVNPTIKALQQGRDELVEKAVELIKNRK